MDTWPIHQAKTPAERRINLRQSCTTAHPDKCNEISHSVHMQMVKAERTSIRVTGCFLRRLAHEVAAALKRLMLPPFSLSQTFESGRWREPWKTQENCGRWVTVFYPSSLNRQTNTSCWSPAAFLPESAMKLPGRGMIHEQLHANEARPASLLFFCK